jgi:divalent metal cation (Fe/Co/Zn/Cd) transporter
MNPSRSKLVRYALRLEFFTIGWNILEGILAVLAATAAGSVALLGFGIDSFVESTSGGILIWRLRAEKAGGRSQADIQALDERAHKLVAFTLFALAAYVTIDACSALWNRDRPESSPLGIAVTALSLGVMWWLAREKRRAAHALGSRALEADSFQTTACWWLSLIVLAGIGLNAVLGWWWADPVAALGMTWFLVKEGRQAWVGADDCCSPTSNIGGAGALSLHGEGASSAGTTRTSDS